MATLKQTEMKKTFDRVAKAWKQEAGQHSSVSRIAMHPAYQRIIAMGQDAVPLILEDLRKAPHHWFWALSAITNESPIPSESRGDLKAMSDAWIAWGRKKGHCDNLASVCSPSIATGQA